MTPEQFWDQDCQLVKAYRKAFAIKQEQANQLAWIQGMYVYDALCSLQIVVAGFAKSGQHRHQYPSKAYDFGFNDREKKRKKKKKQPDSVMTGPEAKAMAMMQMYASSINRKFSKDKKE